MEQAQQEGTNLAQEATIQQGQTENSGVEIPKVDIGESESFHKRSSSRDCKQCSKK